MIEEIKGWKLNGKIFESKEAAEKEKKRKDSKTKFTGFLNLQAKKWKLEFLLSKMPIRWKKFLN